MYRCNEKLIIKSAYFLVKSAIPKFSIQINTNLSFESFHCVAINDLSKNRICAFSRLSHIHKALRYKNCCKMTHKRRYFNSQKKEDTIVKTVHNCLREDLELQSADTVTRLTS